MKLTNEDINNSIENLKAAQRELSVVINYVQNTCNHTNIAECNYQPSEFFSAQPPMRVCLDCGVSEEGWGCGFQVLREKVTGLAPRKISRDDLYSIRCGKYITQ